MAGKNPFLSDKPPGLNPSFCTFLNKVCILRDHLITSSGRMPGPMLSDLFNHTLKINERMGKIYIFKVELDVEKMGPCLSMSVN